MNLVDLRHLTKRQRHKSRRFWQKPRYQIWHRSHLHYSGPEEFVAWWDKRSMGTGGKTPYHCLVKRNGDVWWLVPWKKIAPGAAPLNSKCYNIAVEQDLRNLPPSMTQWKACKELARFLGFEHGLLELLGHSEATGKEDPCPGQFLDLDALRDSLLDGEY